MRKVCVFTGTRADYGLLKPLLTAINEDKNLKLQLVVSGTHLSPEFGLTYREIEEDGFQISEKIEMILSSDTSTGVAKSTGIGIIGFSDAINRLKPDISIVLGDRFEEFAFVYTSFINKVPVVHISGGEITEGALDDSLRHAMTKLSHIHLVATEEYKKRVIQMGEEPWRVHNVGEIGLIGMKKDLMTKEEFEKSINFKLNKKNILVTYHPETLNVDKIKNDFKEILNALSELKEINMIFTKSNADEGGRIINQMIDEFVKSRDNCIAFTSLGRKRYLSGLQFIDIVLGNSSSGLVEVPSFKKTTINIGNRQKGRVKAKSVIDVKPDKNEILKAIDLTYSTSFQNMLKNVQNPYEKEDTLPYILNLLKTVDLEKLIIKKFYDIKFEL